MIPAEKNLPASDLSHHSAFTRESTSSDSSRLHTVRYRDTPVNGDLRKASNILTEFEGLNPVLLLLHLNLGTCTDIEHRDSTGQFAKSFSS